MEMNKSIKMTITDEGNSRSIQWDSIYKCGDELPLPTVTQIKRKSRTFYYWWINFRSWIAYIINKIKH